MGLRADNDRRLFADPLIIEVQPGPFVEERIRVELPAGLTVGEVLDHIGHRYEDDRTTVLLEGHEIEPGVWNCVRPKPGRHMIVAVRPQKKFLKALALVALIAVAAWAFPELTVALLHALAPETALGIFAVAALSFGIVAGAFIGAYSLFGGPKQPELPGSSEAKSLSAPFQNQLTPGGAVPVLFGALRFAPPLAAQPYTEVVGQDIYLRALFTCGYGPVEMSSFRIGTTTIDKFEDVQIEVRRGFSNDSAPKLFANDVTEDGNLQTELTPGVAQIFTTRDETDEAIVDITFPEGLVQFDPKTGNRQGISVSVTIQYRRSGTADALQSIPAQWPNGVVETSVLYAGTAGTGVRTFSGSERVPKRFSVHIPFASRGKYDIHVTRTTAARSTENNQYDKTVVDTLRSIKHAPPVRKKGMSLIAVRIRLTDQIQSLSELNCYAQRLYPYWNGSSWVEPTSAMTSGQLAPHRLRSPAAAFAYAIRGNAAARPLADNRIDTASIWDDWHAACIANAPNKAEEMFRFDYFLQQRTTLWDILTTIAQSARAAPAMIGGKYGVVRDKVQPYRVQLFTPRNSRNFQSQMSAADLPHYLKVIFANEAQEYQEDDHPVYQAGYSAANAETFDELRIPGIVRRTQAEREGRYKMNEAILRPELYSLEVNSEILVARRGQRVGVQQEVVSWGLGAARITAVTLDGMGDATHIDIDDTVTLSASGSYEVMIRKPRADETNRGVQASIVAVDGDVSTLEFTTPLTGDDVPEAGWLVAVGEVGNVVRDAVIREIRPRSATRFQVTMVDYNEAIYAGDALSPDDFDPGIATQYSFSPPGQVKDLVLTEEVTWVGGGVPISTAVATWQPPPGATAASYEVYIDDNGRWRLLDVQPASGPRRLSWRGTIGETITIAVLAVSALGRKLPIADAAQAALVLTGDDGAPSPPDTFNITRLADGTRRFEWTHADPEPDISGYLIRYSTNTSEVWANMTALHTGLLNVSPFETNELAAGEYLFEIRAQDIDGNVSETGTSVIATLGDPRLKAVVLQRLEASLGFPGTKTDCSLVGGKLIAHSTGTWADLSATAWSDASGDDWLFGASAESPIVYETPTGASTVIDLGSDLTFTPLITVTGDGTPTVKVRVATASEGLGALTGKSWADPAQTTGRYVQIQVSMAGSYPKISQITTLLDAEVLVEQYEDVDTSTETASWFSSVATGHFKIGSKGGLDRIVSAQIMALQSVGAGWSWELVSKTQTVNSEVAAEFKIYDNTGTLADASIDVELKGPRKPS